MSYIQKSLLPNETVIFQTKINWTAYIPGLFIFLIGIPSMSAKQVGPSIILVGLILCYRAYLKIKNSEFAVTNKRVLIKVGIFKTNSLETMLNKVEGIHVVQSMMGKMVNSGNIIVKGTGGTNNPFLNIDKPFEFRTAVNQQIENLNSVLPLVS